MGVKQERKRYRKKRGAVAEWSKPLLLREKINKNPKKIPGSPPGLGNL